MTKPALWILTLSVAILSSCASQVQNLQKGAQAFEQHQYDRAASFWKPAAKSGDPYAEYDLGLLWEYGLGSTRKNLSQASQWYLRSARQGYTPAMVRLADIQRELGHSAAALSWLNLGARWGDKNAVSALVAWGKPVPAADLLAKKQYRNAVTNAQAARLAESLNRTLDTL